LCRSVVRFGVVCE